MEQYAPTKVKLLQLHHVSESLKRNVQQEKPDIFLKKMHACVSMYIIQSSKSR